MHAFPGVTSPTSSLSLTGAVTIDVEEWFHAHNLGVPPHEWASIPSRVEIGLDRLLGHLARSGATATFFVLGWLGKRHPAVVRRLHQSGHEVASHGQDHRRIDRQSVDEFRKDIRRSKDVLEQIVGAPVRGYRAPGYSITRQTWWALSELRDAGYTYDSSVYPVRAPHGRYGVPDAPRSPFEAVPGLYEYPLPVVCLPGLTLPALTGAYVRIFPMTVHRLAFRQYQRANAPVILNIHPWELDPDQPRRRAPLPARLLHYARLEEAETRWKNVLAMGRFSSIRQLEGLRPRSASKALVERRSEASNEREPQVNYIAPSGTL